MPGLEIRGGGPNKVLLTLTPELWGKDMRGEDCSRGEDTMKVI